MMTDEFDEIMQGLEAELDEGEAPYDYTTMSDLQVFDEMLRIKHDLMNRGLLLNPVTPEDRDLQSRYYGLFWETRRRGF